MRYKVKIRLRIREIAESQNMDRAKLARKADLTYETVHKLWTDAYRDISLATLVKLSRALGIPVQDLFEVIEE